MKNLFPILFFSLSLDMVSAQSPQSRPLLYRVCQGDETPSRPRLYRGCLGNEFSTQPFFQQHLVNPGIVPSAHPKSQPSILQLPKYKQGKICDFEDQLNRKKVPIDFQLGNSKY